LKQSEEGVVSHLGLGGHGMEDVWPGDDVPLLFSKATGGGTPRWFSGQSEG
jgi:hypothetical protein